jgi:hypothetical protein
MVTWFEVTLKNSIESVYAYLLNLLINDLVLKFDTIPDLFRGGLRSTFNYRVMSCEKSIKLKIILNQLRKISNLVSPSHEACQSPTKSLDQYGTTKCMVLWIPLNLRVHTWFGERLHIPLWSTLTPSMSKWLEIFFVVIYIRNKPPHKNLGPNSE